MDTESVRRLAHLLFVIIASVLLGYLGIKYILPAVLPFLIAWAISFAIRPISVKLSHKVGARVKIVRPFITVLFACLAIGAVIAISYLLFSQVWQILTSLGEGEQLRAFIDGFLFSGGILDKLLSSLGTSVSDLVYKLIDNALSSIFGVASAAAGSIPRIMLFLVITIISTVYFSIDLEGVNRAVLSLLPQKAGRTLVKFKDGFLTAAAGYLRSYFFIFLITFALMLFGLCVLRVRFAVLAAVIIAFLDLLPVIGVGTFLIPWGVFEIIRGNTFLGVGILVLFAVQTVVREVCEPKILGKTLGVHPILTLVILYAGFQIFGFFGILLMPVFTVACDVLIGKKKTANVSEG